MKLHFHKFGQLGCSVRLGIRPFTNYISQRPLLPLQRNVKAQRRNLHATWSILLNHYFLFVDSQAARENSALIIEETDLPAENVPTVLFLHDARADLNQCRSMAELLITKKENLSVSHEPSIQCLLVDLRYETQC